MCRKLIEISEDELEHIINYYWNKEYHTDNEQEKEKYKIRRQVLEQELDKRR